MTLSQMLAWSPRLPGSMAHYLPVLAAAAVAGVGSVVTRGKWAGWAGLPGAAGALAGWALLMPAPAWRAALQPRTLPEHLLAPALAIVLFAAAGQRLHGRPARWAPVAVAALCGWWLARLAGRVEFWRVWASFGIAAWLLMRVSAGQAARTWAASLAIWGGLAATGAPSVLTVPGLVLAAALAPSALLGVRTGLAPALLAVVFLADADLTIGRLPQGGVNGADLACLAALGAPVLAWVLERRLGRRLSQFGAAPAILAALLATGAAWIGAGLLGR